MPFLYKFWKKARVYYTLSISRGGGPRPPAPPPLDSPLITGPAPNFAICSRITNNVDLMQNLEKLLVCLSVTIVTQGQLTPRTLEIYGGLGRHRVFLCICRRYISLLHTSVTAA